MAIDIARALPSFYLVQYASNYDKYFEGGSLLI